MPSLFVRLSASLSLFFGVFLVLFFPFLYFLAAISLQMTFREKVVQMVVVLLMCVSVHVLAYLVIAWKEKKLNGTTNPATRNWINIGIVAFSITAMIGSYALRHDFEYALYGTFAAVYFFCALPASFIAQKMTTWKKTIVYLLFIAPLVMWVWVTIDVSLPLL